MRKSLLAVWLLLPIGAWAYHEGPGQDGMRLDDADVALRAAHDSAAAQKWADAVEDYDAALRLLPADRVADARRVRLERGKAQMMSKQLPEARADLEALVDELAADSTVDPALLTDARRSLASARYYMTWLLRLEGAPREQWEPEIEAARQTQRLLAEEADKRGDAAAAALHREDLESAIRLARMELKDLQGLPIPSQ